jgi:hypothetical protein
MAVDESGDGQAVPGHLAEFQVIADIVNRASADDDHGDQDCPGLYGCPVMQRMWRELAGRAGTCAVCKVKHWPWEPCR